MSFGFLGIQFGYALQGGFMSRIFQTLGASKDELPLLWLAAPLTGLLVQPVVGYLSDRTWHSRWGRRRPYFLIGAVLSSLALLFVPHSQTLLRRDSSFRLSLWRRIQFQAFEELVSV